MKLAKIGFRFKPYELIFSKNKLSFIPSWKYFPKYIFLSKFKKDDLYYAFVHIKSICTPIRNINFLFEKTPNLLLCTM